jgi:uncharacterized protein YaaN involved in tellurite resistance
MAVEETSGARPVAADQPPTPQAAPEAAPEAAPAVQSKIEVLPAVRPATELITQIRSQIQLKDRAGMTQFGERAHKRVTEFSDRILSQTRNKDIGETGRLLSDIIMKAKGLDPAAIQNKGLIARIFGNVKAEVSKFKSRFESVAAQIDAIAIELDKRKDVLRRDIAMMDSLHEETRQAIIDLEAYIEAGKTFAAEFRTHELPRLEAAAATAQEESEKLIRAQEYQDAVQALDRLEKRVFYLQQARQIRVVQSGDETLIENLQASTQLTIPVWKQKMVLLLGLQRQQEALALQKSVTDATNQMMRQASGMMKEQSIAIEEQSQRGIVDMATLADTNRELIDTIESVLRIQQEGRLKRAEAEQQMAVMTEDLRRSLANTGLES